MTKSTSPDRLALTAKGLPGEEPAQAVTRTLNDAHTQAASTMARWVTAMPDVNILADQLREQGRQAQSGNLAQAEAMLMAQASTLDAVFNTLMQRCCESQALQMWETRMRLALKAQAQCRNTIEALAEIKNPRPVLITKQANIAQQQQVNNGVQQAGMADRETSTRERAHARGNGEFPPTKLLGASDGERLDFGATGTTGRTHPHLAPVGAVNRTEDR